MSKVRVLFVCLGNICRSPTAEGVFRKLVQDRGLDAHIEIDSAGTGGWHAGEPPDRRAQAEARRRGIDISGLRARQVQLMPPASAGLPPLVPGAGFVSAVRTSRETP